MSPAVDSATSGPESQKSWDLLISCVRRNLCKSALRNAYLQLGAPSRACRHLRPENKNKTLEKLIERKQLPPPEGHLKKSQPFFTLRFRPTTTPQIKSPRVTEWRSVRRVGVSHTLKNGSRKGRALAQLRRTRNHFTIGITVLLIRRRIFFAGENGTPLLYKQAPVPTADS